MYYGYHFSKNAVGVYNPSSLFNCFSKLEFGYYWFETGPSTLLVEKILKNHYNLHDYSKGFDYPTYTLFYSYMGGFDLEQLLYQVGYLTIISYNDNHESYFLRFPNREVEKAFVMLARSNFFSHKGDQVDSIIRTFKSYINKGDVDSLIGDLKAFFSGVPYAAKGISEEVFRNYFYLVFKVLGNDIRCEERTSLGRIDITLYAKKYIYIIEIKRDKTAQEALDQIEKNGYANKFALDGRKIIKLGINFSTEDRNITEYKLCNE